MSVTTIFYCMKQVLNNLKSKWNIRILVKITNLFCEVEKQFTIVIMTEFITLSDFSRLSLGIWEVQEVQSITYESL